MERTTDRKYILDSDHNPVLEPDLIKWATWFEHDKRIVCQQHVGLIFVSTVFLGIDHNFYQAGPPLLFETMTFPGDLQFRCSTWKQAEVQHKAVCLMARSPRLQLAALWEIVSFAKYRRRQSLKRLIEQSKTWMT